MNRGQWGEALALQFYQEKGYRLLQANYHARVGEIDLILQYDKGFVFVEVKTRSMSATVRPAAHVDARKQKKIRETALMFLQEHQLGDVSMRFDVVEVWVDNAGKSRLNCIENAF